VIREFEFYHGAVLCRLVAALTLPISIHRLEGHSDRAYLVDGENLLYLKHSTSRLTPWGFSFAPEHIADIFGLATEYKNVVIGLICGKDGVAALVLPELEMLINNRDGLSAFITVKRRQKQQYALSGPGGELPYKIPGDDLLRKVFRQGPSISKTLRLDWPIFKRTL
jgi:hypothetical protein